MMNYMLQSSPSVCRDSRQSGQIAVVILLVVAVMATLGLSQISQTTEDLFISSQREEATRVFNAAESGVEEALSEEGYFESFPAALDEFQHDDSLVNVDITPETGLQTTVAQGETATVDVDNVPNNTTIYIYWSRNATGCNAASLMLAVYSRDDVGNPNIRYQFVRPSDCDNATPPRDGDEFIASSILGDHGYNFGHSLTVGQFDRLIRITPLYASTDLLVAGPTSLASQSHLIRSTAQTNVPDDAERTIEQIIEVQRTLPAAPSYMNYALYTNGTIDKSD